LRKSTVKTKRTRGRAKAPSQSGQALILAAVGMFAFVACAGLAVDVGYLRYQRRLQQTAADSAALAGAAAAGTGGNVSQSALDDAKLNGFEDGVVLPGSAQAVRVQVTGPTTFFGKPNAVQVQVFADHPNFFMRIFGPALSTTSFTTTATAQYVQARNCMFALPGGGGITINATVNMVNCSVLDAQNLNGTGSLTAAAIGVSGTSSLTTTPNAVTGILQTPDPFTNMVAPNPGPGHGLLTIDNNNFPPRPPRRRGGQPIPQNVTVTPGSYTGISIAATFLGNVTFQAGNYTIGGSGLSLKGGASVSGNGVMFYMNGGAVTFTNSQKINLTAPTNGAYAGILFFQRKGNPAAATFTGAGGSNLTGGLYFPSATVTLNGAINNPAYLIVVASTIHINTNFTTQSSYLSLPNGSPIKAATLVQ
jgi:Putative Flp pilus-assembly TadE/G-like